VIALLVACGGGDDGPAPDGTPTEPTDGTPTGSPHSAEPPPAPHTAEEPADSAPHTGAAPPPVLFVAQGDRGRLAVSCDDGRTWPVNASDDDDFRCFVDGDCDHDPGAGRGIAWGDGVFVATFGWGYPGSVRRLGPGEGAFTTVLAGHTFAGVAHDAGVFLAAERPPFRSTDGGETFGAAGDVDSAQWNARRTGGGDGLFLVAFDSGATDLNVSTDAGGSFRRPSGWPSECGRSIQWEGGIAAADGVALVLGGDGTACRSTDGGDTWTAAPVGGTVSGRLVRSGGAFVAWGEAGGVPVRFSSTDGAAWTTTPLTGRDPAGGATTAPWIGAVACAEHGTCVAVNAGWDQWYERQRFFRSEDGISWDELPAGAFVGSHPVRFVAAGASTAAICP
jgi:hypothetical protein